jgi:hypothetical protein
MGLVCEILTATATAAQCHTSPTSVSALILELQNRRHSQLQTDIHIFLVCRERIFPFRSRLIIRFFSASSSASTSASLHHALAFDSALFDLVVGFDLVFPFDLVRFCLVNPYRVSRGA